jgi:ATP/ADP translocase
MTEPGSDSGTSDSAKRILRLLRRLIDVTPAELPALGWCWLYIFSVLASYYILRPIRDQMGVAGGVNNLPWLFTGTLIVMLILNVPFSAVGAGRLGRALLFHLDFGIQSFCRRDFLVHGR